MNEFTKEELNEIIGWADYSVGSGLCYTETDPLYSKIHSMIDNYCEHLTTTPTYGYDPIDRCDDCGRIING